LHVGRVGKRSVPGRPLEKLADLTLRWVDDLLTALAPCQGMSIENALLASVEHLQTESETLRTLLNQKRNNISLLTSRTEKISLPPFLGRGTNPSTAPSQRVMPGQTAELPRRRR